MNCPSYSVFFTRLSSNEMIEESCTDFVAQLAGFMASLIVDAPSEAYWITELAKYDFRGASAYLVASVPGIHAHVSPSFNPEYTLSGMMEIMHSKSLNFNLLGYVKSSVVGLSHRFYSKNDSTGKDLKTLALFLKNCKKDVFGLSEVVLQRTPNITADVNAVSVLVSDLNEFSKGAYIQLGFVPKDTAKWISPLSDAGYFSFSAFIFPKEALTAVLGSDNAKVQLILHVSRGPNFFNISRSIQPEHFVPLCSLLATVQRHMGIWRLQEVLCRYRWPESLETDFVYGCSSIGTSVCPQYLASFSAASGKKSLLFTDSEESDPEWGRWNTTHELRSPSLSILFPTIERSRNAVHGIQSSRCLLAFSEKTWRKLRNSGTLHDEVPHPNVRLGYPMHVKVACRRFQSKEDNALSFGWIYCGSHNFSPSAWGQPMQCPTSSLSENSALSSRLHICNYELGIVFVFPPPKGGILKEVVDAKRPNLDDIALPFVMPAPKYSYNDRPTTAQAVREVVAFEKGVDQHAALTEEDAIDEDIADDEDVFEYVDTTKEKDDEKIYAEMLWSETYSSAGTP